MPAGVDSIAVMPIQIDYDAILELRVQGVKDSTARVRLAFFIMVVSCGAVLITLYNVHFSWNERFLTPHSGMQQATPAFPDAAEPAVVELRRQRDAEMVKALVENKNVSVGLLGLRIGSCDLAVFGAMAMFLVSMYNCLCTRRSSEDICSLVGDVLSEDVLSKDLHRMYVWYGTRQSLVLNTELPHCSQLRNGKTDKRLRFVQLVVKTLNWLPAIATASILVGELVYWLAGEPPTFKNLTPHYQIQFVVSVIVGFMLFIFVIYLNMRTGEYRAEMLDSAGLLEEQCQKALQVKSAIAGG